MSGQMCSLERYDSTIADTMALSYSAYSTVSAGLIAEQSSARKVSEIWRTGH